MSIDWKLRAPKLVPVPEPEVRPGLKPETTAARDSAKPMLLVGAPDHFVGRMLTWRDKECGVDVKQLYSHGLSWEVDATGLGELWVEDNFGHEVLVVESAVQTGLAYTVRIDEGIS